jgi:hypothetical protein
MLRGRGQDIGPWEKFQILDRKSLLPVHISFPLID